MTPTVYRPSRSLPADIRRATSNDIPVAEAPRRPSHREAQPARIRQFEEEGGYATEGAQPQSGAR
jgi:hypothetical protein